MTVTNIGLPQSPMVDGNGNLTSEWLLALGRIEKLSTLKQQQAALGALDLTALDDALKGMEAGFATMMREIRPNIVVFTDINSATVPDIAGTGVSHLLGTEEFVAMLRFSDGTIAFNGGARLTEGAMAIKNVNRWTTTQPANATSYFTITAYV